MEEFAKIGTKILGNEDGCLARFVEGKTAKESEVEMAYALAKQFAGTKVIAP